MFEGTVFRLVGADALAPSSDPEVSRARLLEAVLDPADRDRQNILELLEQYGGALASRATLPGHLTGSALVVRSDGGEVLLMLHTKLGRWLQPGGHADGDHELAGVALREAGEESGIPGLGVLLPAIDVDIHEIPPRGAEPAHLHLDLRYVVIAPPDARPVGNRESRELRWVAPARVGELTEERSLQRLVERGTAALARFQAQDRG